jgi:hypothetical protein
VSAWLHTGAPQPLSPPVLRRCTIPFPNARAEGDDTVDAAAIDDDAGFDADAGGDDAGDAGGDTGCDAGADTCDYTQG